jgi:hypothetical protein
MLISSEYATKIEYYWSFQFVYSVDKYQLNKQTEQINKNKIILNKELSLGHKTDLLMITLGRELVKVFI